MKMENATATLEKVWQLLKEAKRGWAWWHMPVILG
jgi:hypothetical protein